MLVRNATLADGRVRDVRIEGERIVAVGESLAASDDVIDATGKRLLPGMIDVHVHFRQPGDPHKETWQTGTRSAAAGGVTTAFDQPNTVPPTISAEAVREKETYAEEALVDYGLNGGVVPEWDPDSLLSAPITALGEVFLADSTGDMGIDEGLFEAAVDHASDAGVTVTVHAEDAERFDEEAQRRIEADEGEGRDANADLWSQYRPAKAEAVAVEQACRVGSERGARVHVAHTSTPEGIDLAREAGMTCEVTPHYLLLSREDLSDLGTFGRMNPPLRSETRREAVYERVREGAVDVIATDHAPHAREEKEAPLADAPSGIPGVETALPLLLNEAREGRLNYELVRDLTAANPADLFGLESKGRIREGKDADLVLVDPDETREIRGEDLHSKAGWTPFEGRAGVFPELTMVRGEVVYDRRDGEERFGDPIGENVRK